MATIPGTEADGPHRVVFSSERLPRFLDERGRRERWRAVYDALYGPLEVDYAWERPFWARFEFLRLGELSIASCASTTERFVRTRQCVAAAGSDNVHLAINGGTTPMQVHQRGREATLSPGGMALVSDSLPGQFAAGAVNRWVFVTLPEARLREVAGEAGRLVALPIDGAQPAPRHLRGYVDLLLGSGGQSGDAQLSEHVATTLLDLVGLVLGSGGEAREIGAIRGVRAARLQHVLAAIRAGYADPDFSVHAVAAGVGLSARYVQDLLHETGTSFTERVLEQRLQRARAMLLDRGYASRRIIDVALDSGFNEVSYFNRAFRRRFGTSPSAVRVSRGGRSGRS